MLILFSTMAAIYVIMVHVDGRIGNFCVELFYFGLVVQTEMSLKGFFYFSSGGHLCKFVRAHLIR